MPLLALGFVGLLVGVAAGLARLGWPMPAQAAAAASLHGPLMIGAFLGTVIALERAVAIGRVWGYLGPLCAGAGGIALIAGAAAEGAWLLVAGSAVLVAMSIDIVRRQRALFTVTLALGAACWTAGNVLWASGLPVRGVVGWWLLFPILTIAGERLELSRFMPPSRFASGAFAAILVVLTAGVAGSERAIGAALFGAALLALAVWLVRHDIARRTVRATGLTRYIAVCLLSGYVWLAAGGVALIGGGGLAPGSPLYDAAVHALGVGFVFSMIFGHAPIIVPAVLRVPVPYSPAFYVPLALLHASLVARIGGDALQSFTLTRIGGLGNALAIAAFIAIVAGATLRGRSVARTRS